MTACVSDLHLEAWIEWRAARDQLANRDSADNRARVETARVALDDLLDAANDCE